MVSVVGVGELVGDGVIVGVAGVGVTVGVAVGPVGVTVGVSVGVTWFINFWMRWFQVSAT